MLALTAWAWSALPADGSIPVHWGLDGRPDRYGGKGEALLVTPIMAVVLTAVLAFVPRFESRKQNLAASGSAFATIWIAVIAFMAVMEVVLVAAAMGRAVDMLVIFPVAIGALFAVIGAQMGRTRSNHFMGIRTPWTLSSELSWERTHRLGSWTFIGLGALLGVAGLLRNEALLVIALVAAMPLQILSLCVYSYVVWKQDPNRRGASAS